MMTPLTKLKNIGPKTISWMQAVDINSVEDLEALGAVEAYYRLKTALPEKVSLNALWGLHAALLDMPWQMVTPDMKAELLHHLHTEFGFNPDGSLP